MRCSFWSFGALAVIILSCAQPPRPSSKTHAISPGFEAYVLSHAEQAQQIYLNATAALQQRIFADQRVPNSNEFSLEWNGQPFVAQRSESLATGTVRVYFAPIPHWHLLDFVTPETASDAFSQALLDRAALEQKIRLNPDAALQKSIFHDGFVPTSGEVGLTHAGESFVVQRAEHLHSGEVRAYHVPVGRWSEVAFVVRPSSGQTIGLTGRILTRRAGTDFTPTTCAQCVRVRSGRLVDPNGTAFVGIGANMPMLRDGGGNGFTLDSVAGRGVRVVRIFASGGNLADNPADMQTWPARIEQKVNELWSRGIRTIVSFADYYHALPGEQVVPDNYYNDQFNYCGTSVISPELAVRPWPWYRPGLQRFDFKSACPNKEKLWGAPNFQVVYKPFALSIVQRLATHPGVLAWSLGNELRALGRGGAGGDKISQLEAVDHFAAFAEEMIGSIRAIDPNHLIMIGTMSVTAVSDEAVADDGTLGQHWAYAFDRMLEVPVSFWSVTMFDLNKDARRDLLEFRRFGVPVIATELDWSCPPPQPSPDELEGTVCALMNEGFSLVMPWARDEMEHRCGAAPIQAAWDRYGWLAWGKIPSGGCGAVGPVP